MKAQDQWLVSDALWARIEPLLPIHVPKPHPLGCHRRRIDNRKLLNGIFFVLRTGAQWKSLDVTGICSGSSAHRRFQEWSRAGVFRRLWEEALKEYDDLKGLDWRWLSMDGTMTKAPLGGGATGHNPTDRSKQGTKRSLMTEGAGIPVGLAIAGANRHDMKLVEATLGSIPKIIDKKRRRDPGAHEMCMDKGYDFEEVRKLVAEFGSTAHIPVRGKSASTVEGKSRFKPRRWVVERTHSWMNRFRRILIRWEKKKPNYLAMLHFSCALIACRQCQLG
jgi:transposase